MKSTYYSTREGDFSDTLRIAEAFIGDYEGPIHNGVGWMVRKAYLHGKVR